MRDDSGVIVESGGLGAYKLRIGDCFNFPDETVVISLEALPCSQPHDAEAYHDFEQPGTEWPGGEQVSSRSDLGCFEQFEAFVGFAWEDSALDFAFLEPTQESWEEDDDREVTCAIVSYDGSKLIGSTRGSGH